MLDSDLEDSDDEADSHTIPNLKGDENFDAMVGDLETPGRDGETEVSAGDGGVSDKEVSVDEGTDDEGMVQYWKLTLKEGARKVAVQFTSIWMCGLPTHLQLSSRRRRTK